MKKVLITLVIAFAVIISGSAQKITLKSGNLAFLKGQKNLNIEFTYDNLAVGKFENENDYIAKKVDEYNSKEAGKGDIWKEAWFNDRPTRYEPKFLELFGKYLEPHGITADRGLTADYTMVVHTTFIEPGFNVGVARQNAYTNSEILFKDASGAVIATLTVLNSPGATAFGYDFDSGVRISESYAKMGKSLAGFVIKKGLK